MNPWEECAMNKKSDSEKVVRGIKRKKCTVSPSPLPLPAMGAKGGYPICAFSFIPSGVASKVSHYGQQFSRVPTTLQ